MGTKPQFETKSLLGVTVSKTKKKKTKKTSRFFFPPQGWKRVSQSFWQGGCKGKSAALLGWQYRQPSEGKPSANNLK